METDAALTEYEQRTLATLDTDGGFTTGDVAKRVQPMFGHSMRTHSAAVRQWLLGLERRGLVKRLDDEKPVCWVKVNAGTIAW